jgi:glycolate oxidase
MNRILAIDPVDLIAVVQPGVTAGTGDGSRRMGLTYPPDPGSSRASTLGGNVATNAGGLHGLKYGTTGNYVLGIEAVLADGERIRAGGRLVKNVAGYDLSTCSPDRRNARCHHRTDARGPHLRRTPGIAYFADLEMASHAVTGILNAGILPARWSSSTPPASSGRRLRPAWTRPTGRALLLFGDDGAPAEVNGSHHGRPHPPPRRSRGTDRDRQARSEACSRLAAARCPPWPASAGHHARGRRRPRSRLSELVRDPTSPTPPGDHRHLRHAGDGNAHPTGCFKPDDRNARRVAAAFDDIDAAIRLDGTITGEHGVGAANSQLPHQLGATHHLIRRVKRAFDPAGILNPGKLGT